MALSRPLLVAIASGVALVAVVAADSAMNRVVTLEAMDEAGAWRTVFRQSEQVDEHGRPVLDGGGRAIEVDPNGTLDFRLRVDNGYAWSYSERFEVWSGSELLHEGRVTAGARDEGSATFTLAVADLGGTDFRKPTTREPETPHFAYANLQLTIDGRTHYVSIPLEDAT